MYCFFVNSFIELKERECARLGGGGGGGWNFCPHLLSSTFTSLSQKSDRVCSYCTSIGELFGHNHNLALVNGCLLHRKAKAESQV